MVMAYKKAVGTEYIPQGQKVVKKKQKAKASYKKLGWFKKATSGIVLIALLFTIGMSVVIQQVWLNYLGFQINQLKNEIIAIETNNEKLKLKIANVVSLDKIEEVATTQLGMVYPNNETVHYIFSPQAPEENGDYNVQLASRAMSSGEGIMQEVRHENNYPKQVWLGTVQDFFYHWLARDSKR